MPVLPGGRALIDQPQEGLVHEASDVEGVAVALAAHVAGRDLAKVRVHERDQATESVRVPTAPRPKQLGYDTIDLRCRHILKFC
jgi:hypothetical protein